MEVKQMPYTVENQRRVLVHRDMPKDNEGNFLLIKKDNLYAAYRDLNATALCLYLYLAGNKDGFDLAFSPKAIHNEMGLPESTCRDQFKVLVNKGYLVRRSETSNRYDFYEIPKEKKTAETACVF
ncbi:MAG: hypothetical protein IKU85_03860 [Bacteroidaceae bacterium]|nr:hypothetical protein [Bacteroidaceae bacterium]